MEAKKASVVTPSSDLQPKKAISRIFVHRDFTLVYPMLCVRVLILVFVTSFYIFFITGATASRGERRREEGFS